MYRKLIPALLFLLLVFNLPGLEAKSEKKNLPIRMLIVDGFSNHDYEQTITKDFPNDIQTVLRPRARGKEIDPDSAFCNPFNGKDLTGWGYRVKNNEGAIFESFEGKTESSDHRYTCQDGIITVHPFMEGYPRFGQLWTRQEYQGDFIFTIEFRASINADSGIFIRGKQLQCRDYLVAGPYKDLKKYKPQDWNKIEVVVKNNVARCTCNGEVLEEAFVLPSTGPLGLEADRGQMEYRNLQVKAITTN
jgi:hypothetical protein